MYDVLLISEIIISFVMIAVVLIQQKNVSLNISSMSGGMGAVTKRGAEKTLHNMTIVIALLFIANSLALFIAA